MIRNRMRELLTTTTSAGGAFITMTDPAATELAAIAGFQFVVIECEHAAMTLETVQTHLRVAHGRDMGAIVRVPADDWGLVQRVLDIGADGILVPHIVDKTSAKRAVEAVRYPPLGRRGMYPAGAAAEYSAHGLGGIKQLTEWMNENAVLAVMMEEPAAIEQIGEILEGIDLVVVGPSDLSAALGAIGAAEDARLREAIDRVFDACRSAGVKFGIPIEHASYSRSASDLKKAGAWFLTSGSDASVLLQGFRAAFAKTQESANAPAGIGA
ncbi:MAG: HpcH/HpaI aldolase family protein [Candidatus Dormibacteraceae bacterium]